MRPKDKCSIFVNMMKNNEKLKVVFDFIAEYLSEDNSVVSTETSNEDVVIEKKGDDALKRAYTIMKKMDAIDQVNAKVSQQVKETVNPIMKELKKVKDEYAGKTLESEKNGNRSGVTIDAEGVVSKISVPPLVPDVDEDLATHNED